MALVVVVLACPTRDVACQLMFNAVSEFLQSWGPARKWPGQWPPLLHGPFRDTRPVAKEDVGTGSGLSQPEGPCVAPAGRRAGH